MFRIEPFLLRVLQSRQGNVRVCWKFSLFFRFVARPKIDDCEKIQHLTSPTTGKYLRSACLITTKSSFTDAAANCAAKNMKLFRVDSSAAQSSLTSFVQNQFYHFTENSIWIDDNSTTSSIYTTTCAESQFSICEFSADATTPPRSEISELLKTFLSKFFFF
jgi:hypothetical protein